LFYDVKKAHVVCVVTLVYNITGKTLVEKRFYVLFI